jgi:hypothetical protein
VSLSRTSVRVPARGEAGLSVTLDVPAATAGDSSSFQEVAGLVTITPASAADNAGIALRVPYYMVPRAQADVATAIGTLTGTNPSTTATVTNRRGAIPGDADFYAWGLFDQRMSGDASNSNADHQDPENPSYDVRAVGVQSAGLPGGRQLIAFAINTYNRWSNASTNEFDIYVDVDGDGKDDYIIVGADLGAVQTGSFNGVMGSFVFSTRSPGASIVYLASAPTDSSTAILAVRSTQLCRKASKPGAPDEPCLSATNPRFTYRVESYDVVNGGPVKVVAGKAKFNPWSSSISQGDFVTVAPGATDASVTVTVNSAEAKLSPALGVMVVTFDNKSGADEAQLIKVDVK